jgi:hypothetical protein
LSKGLSLDPGTSAAKAAPQKRRIETATAASIVIVTMGPFMEEA